MSAWGVADISGRRRVVVRVEDFALDVGALPGAHPSLSAPSLEALLAAGPAVWDEVRGWLGGALDGAEEHLHPLAGLELVLPFAVADYVDFYASEHHATNVGRMFRPDAEALLPNWKHLPVGYHGRAGTVLVSGTDVVRPCGQRRGRDGPSFVPTQRLDVEVELAYVVGVGSTMGEPVAAQSFTDHVFGVVVLNDWSARDIQAWEYQPLGPFLGKSFATSVSAWVVPLADLDAARVPPPPRSHTLLPYLADDPAQPWGLDLSMQLSLNGSVLSRPPFATMYWTGPQMLAHMTANGASLRTGDLFASGTVSGPERDQRGSLLELSWDGTETLLLDDGSERTFLEDGDEVAIAATAPAVGGGTLDLGEVRGRVLPAHPSRA